MNLTRKKAFLMILPAYAFLSLASGCKSTVSTKTNTMAGAGQAKTEKETGLVKSEIKLRSAGTASINQRAVEALKIMKENAPKVRLNEYFNAIANADNTTTANNTITKALAMFASSTTPVVLEILDQNGKSNEDHPTTITAYFDYLKAQRKNLDDIKNLKIDTHGKITEVELVRNNSTPLQ